MGDPKTVRGWCLLLPEPLSRLAIQCLNRLRLDWDCYSLSDAVRVLFIHNDEDDCRYWDGVCRFINGNAINLDLISTSGLSDEEIRHTIDGYNAAKAAFEAQEKNIPEHSANVDLPLPETCNHRYSKSMNEPWPKTCIDCGALVELPIPETLPTNVAYIAEAPTVDDRIRDFDTIFAEIQAQMQVLDRLLDDLKGVVK